MGQEYFINSTELEAKVRDLLPSQGGAGAGFDLSASTQIIPIIDLTESAEGSNIRQDLQTAFSDQTGFSAVANATTTLITNTGYWRIFGNISLAAGGTETGILKINDGATDFNVLLVHNTPQEDLNLPFDFVIYLKAGDSFVAVSSTSNVYMNIAYRQIADITGELVNP